MVPPPQPSAQAHAFQPYLHPYHQRQRILRIHPCRHQRLGTSPFPILRLHSPQHPLRIHLHQPSHRLPPKLQLPQHLCRDRRQPPFGHLQPPSLQPHHRQPLLPVLPFRRRIQTLHLLGRQKHTRPPRTRRHRHPLRPLSIYPLRKNVCRWRSHHHARLGTTPTRRLWSLHTGT